MNLLSIEFLQLDNNFSFHQQNLQKFVPELLKVEKNIPSEILKCVFEVTEYQSLFRSKLDFQLVRCNISLVWEYGIVSLLTL